tara:strand:+ start:15137 stop:15436 length:300 start_codon:yes stop_codon:yes gene_type:complete
MSINDTHFRKVLEKKINEKFRSCDIVSKTGEAQRKRWKKVADSYITNKNPADSFMKDANKIIDKLIHEKGENKGFSKFLNYQLSTQLREVLKEFENNVK